MLRRLIGEGIELTTSLDGELWPVRADPGQVEQVIVHLVVNARDAVFDGGRISLETANLELAAEISMYAGDIPAGSYASLRVRDTGCGMDEATASRIFEPFFTTKEADKGTGLGLSTVYGIVNQSGGSIRLETAPGEGSAFTILLPRVAGVSLLPEPESRDVQYRRHETILVLEDADPVRKLVERYLDRHGYHVLSARSGMEAIRLCRRHTGSIDLLLCDVVLPKMRGPEIARRVQKLCPEISVILMSGYDSGQAGRHAAEEMGSVLLTKPFAPSAMLQTVRAALDSKQPSAAGVETDGPKPARKRGPSRRAKNKRARPDPPEEQS